MGSGSGSSAQAYQLTAEEAAAVDTTLAQVPSLRRRVEDLEVRSLRQPEAAAQSVQETESRFPQAGAPGAPGVHDSEKLHEEVAQLKEEVRSLRQAEAAAAQRIAELESRLREAEAQNVQEPESRPPQEKSVEQPSSVGGTPSPVELMTKASQEDSLPREDARVQRDAEETGAVPRSKPMSEDQDATTAPAGDKPGDKLVEIKDSSVWDADVDIKEPISQLQFDPRSSTGKAEEVASLEAEEVQEARKAQEAAAAEEAAKCTTPHDLAKDGDDKKVFVALLSGKDCECLWLQDRTIRQLKEEAQQKLDIAIKHLIGPNMEPLDEEKMLAEGNVMPGITLTVVAVDQAAEAKQAAEDEKEAAECRTDILLAALNGRLGAVRHILRTPGAVASKPEEICRVLAAKAEVDASVSGSTPLHFAAIKGQVEVVKLLVEAKASVIVKSKYGQTPLDDARKQGHDEVVTILENAA